MIELVIAIGIVAFLLLIFAISLPPEHFLLKLLIIFFILGLLLLIPKAYLDNENMQTCKEVINSTTLDVNTTTYTYVPYCYTPAADTHTTKQTFFTSITWFIIIFVGYIFIYINWWFWGEKMVRESEFWKRRHK